MSRYVRTVSTVADDIDFKVRTDLEPATAAPLGDATARPSKPDSGGQYGLLPLHLAAAARTRRKFHLLDFSRPSGTSRIRLVVLMAWLFLTALPHSVPRSGGRCDFGIPA